MKVLDAASMQRWNDKIRPVELRELDKQAHKMIIAYFLGKFEEDTTGFSWLEIIEGGFFEFLERLVLTDLKPQVLERIRQDSEKYRKLNEWVLNRLSTFMLPLETGFEERFRSYFLGNTGGINRRILAAAHLYATRWEFDIIDRSNPQGYEMPAIRTTLQDRLEQYHDLSGIQQLALFQKYRNFIDLCGQLRFQLRWGHVNMVPRISVLGHMLIVAMVSFLFSLRIGACARRSVNNYFTGLFHDLPEVLTRDIISPVKRSVEGLEELIKGYEKEQMEKEVFSLIPHWLRRDMEIYTQNEFSDIVTVEGEVLTVTPEEISRSYNGDTFNPRDGTLVKAVDDLAAFVEAYNAIDNGVKSRDLKEAERSIRAKYQDTQRAGINFGRIYREFEL